MEHLNNCNTRTQVSDPVSMYTSSLFQVLLSPALLSSRTRIQQSEAHVNEQRRQDEWSRLPVFFFSLLLVKVCKRRWRWLQNLPSESSANGTESGVAAAVLTCYSLGLRRETSRSSLNHCLNKISLGSKGVGWHCSDAKFPILLKNNLHITLEVHKVAI